MLLKTISITIFCNLITQIRNIKAGIVLNDLLYEMQKLIKKRIQDSLTDMTEMHSDQ